LGSGEPIGRSAEIPGAINPIRDVAGLALGIEGRIIATSINDQPAV